MIFPEGAARRTSLKAACEKRYDAVIVGAGISGAIIAKELSQAGKHVLIIEAGPAEDATLKGYENYLQRFYATAEKDNQSPYPRNPNAPMPRSTDAHKVTPGNADASGYLVQTGPMATDTTYTRVLGGTTMHWEGKTPRLLPEDFEMRSRFGQSEDWPINYDTLEPYYRRAEHEFGVSGDVEQQKIHGTHFPPDYVYPMHAMPFSYLDQQVDQGIRGTQVELDGQMYPLRILSFPQARNGIPNSKYDNGKGYRPHGAVSTHQVDEGERCQGNNNCVPLCPVQAKYHAGKTLSKALQSGRVDILPQSVASKIHIDPDSGRVSHIDIKHYADPKSSDFVINRVRGAIFVLCANAIENARLMLASDLPSSSGLVGRNLMDHAYLLNWALMPQVCGTMRGTNVTGGIIDLRGGSFRKRQAAFAVDIHNDGWGWAVGSPYSDLNALVDEHNKFGKTLRHDLADRITRQLLLAFMIEVLPDLSNRVSVDPRYTDQLGNMRPVISYNLPEYTLRGVAYARRFAKLVFQRLGAADHTEYHSSDFGYVSYDGNGYAIRGGNHLAGTHIMGTNKRNSVVNVDQRCWDHENLYLVGGGSMPTIGTANITPTIAALCFRSAEAMLGQLS